MPVSIGLHTIVQLTSVKPETQEHKLCTNLLDHNMYMRGGGGKGGKLPLNNYDMVCIYNKNKTF